MDVKDIIEKFGGLAAMARALGHKNVTTIQGWRDSNRIPPWRHHEVMVAAEACGISLSAADLQNEAA